MYVMFYDGEIVEAMGYGFDPDDDAHNDFALEHAWEDLRRWDYNVLVDLTAYLEFHCLSLKDGYYGGVQIYIDNIEGFDESWTNEDCRVGLDMCRSEAIRKYRSEVRKITKWLHENAPKMGFYQVELEGVFSNGEGVWRRVAA